MDLLWDILRELGILKKKKPGEPKKDKPAAAEEIPLDPATGAKEAIEKQAPEALARAVKRMMKDK